MDVQLGFHHQPPDWRRRISTFQKRLSAANVEAANPLFDDTRPERPFAALYFSRRCASAHMGNPTKNATELWNYQPQLS
jgi:hypothetical protein